MNDFNKLFDFIMLIEENGPVLVHCKAGVGRTGTFIFIHYLYHLIKNKKYPDIINIIMEMRKARIWMIQGEIQFNFALEFLIMKFKNQKNICKRKKLVAST